MYVNVGKEQLVANVCAAVDSFFRFVGPTESASAQNCPQKPGSVDNLYQFCLYPATATLTKLVLLRTFTFPSRIPSSAQSLYKPRRFPYVRSIAMAAVLKKPKVITIVTGNANKLKEIKDILGDTFPHELVINDADLPEYQGDLDTVSRLKCKSAYELIKGPVIVEDTSLCFNALGGLPGPYVKWFLKNIGSEGMHKLLIGFNDYSAQAMATLAYCESDNGQVRLFKGVTEGTIVPPRGKGGFGWDTCFQPVGYDKTYGEMTAEEKNTISHRKRAVEAMKQYFSNDSS